MDRTDRAPTALRPLALSQGLLSRADGSAQFAFGNVAVLASITGPAEVRIRDELVDRATLDIHLRPLRGQGGPASRAAESTLAALLAPLILLHLYPRALLQLTLQTVSLPSTAFAAPLSTAPSFASSSGSTADLKGKGKARGTGAGAAEKAARINAAMMALVDAGVQTRGMLVAVAVAVVPSQTAAVADDDDDDEELRLDPTQQEELASTSTHVFAFSFGQAVGGPEGACVGVDSVGHFSQEQLFDAKDLAQQAAQTVLAFIRRSVETKYGVKGAPPPAQVRALAGGGGVQDDEELEVDDEEESDDDDQVMIEA